MNFYEKYLIGETSIDDIDDYIEEWHNGDSTLELHEYLGLTEIQYNFWLLNNTLDF